MTALRTCGPPPARCVGTLASVSLPDMVIGLAAFGDLLAGGGHTAALGSLVDIPLVVVDLDSPGDRQRLHRAGAAPLVAVGVSRDGTGAGPFEAFDVVLVEGRSEPAAPWVGVADLSESVEQLSAAVARSPRAAVTFVQVLRAGEGASVEAALIIESLAYSTLQGGPEFARWLAGRPTPLVRPSEERVLAIDRQGDVLHLVLARPSVRNAVNAALRDALCDGLAVAIADPSISDVHLGAIGPDFCSGGDLDEFGTSPDPTTAHLVRTTRSPTAALSRVAGRTSAHLYGACVGAGIEMAAAAGRVFAAPSTRIWLPEVAMGLIPGAGGTASLPRRVGRHRTAWLGLTGSVVDATVARRWGLVDEMGVPSPDGFGRLEL
jgi:enoyl-CoA hydratase/carnithine racemase